jgi:hypothetical protein
MYGGAMEIELLKPFGEAFDLMKKILFQPFDFKKWFVIGFAAWLSHLGSGNYNFNFRDSDWKNVPVFQDLRDTINQTPHSILIFGLVAFIVLVFAAVILLAWLRARGRFVLVDCIVRNRGAIAEPWREYRKQGNSYFLFALLIGLIIAILAATAALPLVVLVIRTGTRPHLNDVYVICVIALWVAFVLLLVFAWGLISHFMVAVMYRRRCLAGEAFRSTVSLVASYPGEITLYCLFWIALGIATVIASCVTILATCCVALLPYIGTVIMLPIFVCLRAFGLCFIRQFGPEYDVWAGVPSSAPEPPPLPN